MNSTSLTWPVVTSRVAAGLLGSYAFVWGFAMALTGVLMRAGMPYDEALTLVYLLAFIVYLVAFCWAFAARSLARVWVVLAGGGALMSVAGWALTRGLA
jgi:membrane-bound ClpP family serine protease